MDRKRIDLQNLHRSEMGGYRSTSRKPKPLAEFLRKKNKRKPLEISERNRGYEILSGCDARKLVDLLGFRPVVARPK